MKKIYTKAVASVVTVVMAMLSFGCSPETAEQITSADTGNIINSDNDITIEGTEEVLKEESIVLQRQPITENDFLKAAGKNLKNGSGTGETVNLRGTNVGGWLLQEFWMTPTEYSSNVSAEIDIYEFLTEKFGKEKMLELVKLYQSNYWTEKDFDNCAAMGMNCLRLPFWYRNIVEENGEFYDDWYETFDRFLEEAGKRGIYVILDMHGAPGSQNGSDHSGADGHDAKEANSNFFFGDDETVQKNQELYYKIWEAIALRYAGNPVVAGYDLLNEPYCTYRYNSKLNANELHKILWDVYDNAYDRIRAIDPDHVIIMEATWDPSDLPNPGDYGWKNIMYEYHNYLYDDYENKNGQQIANMRKKINQIQTAGYDVPSYMGEFSYFNNLDAWDEGLKLLNEAGLNWTTWTYKVTSKNGNWGLYHQSLGAVNLETSTEIAIKNTWSNVGRSFANQGLVDVVVKHINSPVIEKE